MAFELKLVAGSITNEGETLIINDNSVWADSAEIARDQYGVLILAEYRIAVTAGTPVVSSDPLPLTDITWLLNTIGDGRYTVNSYAFLRVGVGAVPVTGDVRIQLDNTLVKYNGATWNVVLLEDEFTEAVYTGALDVPYLADAYIYRNQLNLEYIAEVKGDLAGGADRNKLYYKRTDLDYFSALITGAGYNFALFLFSNYYEIVVNLNDIRLNQQIS